MIGASSALPRRRANSLLPAPDGPAIPIKTILLCRVGSKWAVYLAPDVSASQATQLARVQHLRVGARLLEKTSCLWSRTRGSARAGTLVFRPTFRDSYPGLIPSRGFQSLLRSCSSAWRPKLP